MQAPLKGLTLLSAALLGAGAARAQATEPPLPQTVVVSATRHAMALVDAPASITVVTPQQIDERGADNLFEALRGELGVSLIGRTISGRRNISLRGMDGRHTLFLVDGKRIGNSDGVIGHSDFQYDWVAVEDIERIEIIRGPMSVLYGAEALGGVVNIITRATGTQWSGRAIAEGSKADGGLGGGGHRAGVSVGGPLGEAWRLAVSADDSRRQEIVSPLDSRIGDIEGRHKNDGSARLTWLPAAGHQVELEHREGDEQRWAGMKERSGQRRFFRSLTDIDRSHDSLAWSADWGGAASARSTLRAYGSHVGMGNLRSNGVAALRPNILDDHVVDGQFSAEPARGRLFTAGFEWREERLENIGLPASESQARHRALYGQGEFELGRTLSLTAGLRHDHHSRFGDEWSPRVYAVWRPAGAWVLKGGYGHGFKAPTLKQISPDYVEDEGPYTYFGNPTLRPERNDSVELGVGWDTAALGAQATLFSNRVTDLIVPVLFGSKAGRAQYRFQNIDRARLQGLELGSRAALPQGFSLEANYTFLDATDGAGQRLEKRPRHVLGLQLAWQQGPWRASLRAEHHGDQLIAPTVVGQPMQALPDLTRLSAQVTRQLGRNSEAIFGVDNLAQLRLADESPLFTWAEAPRTWRLMWRGRW